MVTVDCSLELLLRTYEVADYQSSSTLSSALAFLMILSIVIIFFNKFIYFLNFGRVGSSVLCVGFL